MALQKRSAGFLLVRTILMVILNSVLSRSIEQFAATPENNSSPDISETRSKLVLEGTSGENDESVGEAEQQTSLQKRNLNMPEGKDLKDLVLDNLNTMEGAVSALYSSDDLCFRGSNRLKNAGIQGSDGAVSWTGNIVEFKVNGVSVFVVSPRQAQAIVIKGTTVTVNGKIVAKDTKDLPGTPTHQKASDGSVWLTNLPVGKKMSSKDSAEFDGLKRAIVDLRNTEVENIIENNRFEAMLLARNGGNGYYADSESGSFSPEDVKKMASTATASTSKTKKKEKKDKKNKSVAFKNPKPEPNGDEARNKSRKKSRKA